MNVEQLIYYTLYNDDVVRESVAKTKEGYPLIQNMRSVSGQYPLIEYHQIAGGDVNYADDDVFINRRTFSISYHCPHDEFIEARESMLKALRKVEFKLLNQYSFQNKYTNLTEYTVHVRIMITEEHFALLLAKAEKLYLDKTSEDDVLPSGKYIDEQTLETIIIK